MKNFTTRNRIKIPNRIAALAAILLLVTSVSDPHNPDEQTTLAQQQKDNVVDETAAEYATVAAAMHKPGSFNISSLIFRF